MQSGTQTEPIVAEPEKTLGNVDFVKETESVSEIDPSVAEPEKNIEAKPSAGLHPLHANPEFVVTVDEKEYRAATMTRFPFGGGFEGKSLLECVPMGQIHGEGRSKY